jgi:nicotinamide riboside transporter PnuC
MFNTDIWKILEWVGAFSALSGSLAMAAHKFKPSFAWATWLFSNICYMLVFFSSGQNGLLLMNIGGFFINIFGLYQWIQHDSNGNPKIMKILLSLSLTFGLISIYHIFSFGISPNIKSAEWVGSMMGLMAAFLLASRNKYSFLCWFIWGFSNMILLIVTLMTEQYGVVFLQTGFMLINVYGSITWLKQFKEKHILALPDIPTHG